MATWLWLSRPEESPHGPLTIQQIQAVAELVTTRIEVADVRDCRIRGRTGGTQAIVVVKGQILLGVDLQQADLIDVNTTSRTATLVLPQPRVISVRLDHQQTRIVAMGPYGLWQMVPWRTKDAEVVNRAYAEAQQALEQAAAQSELIAQARAHAQGVLDRFGQAVSWQIKVQWPDK